MTRFAILKWCFFSSLVSYCLKSLVDKNYARNIVNIVFYSLECAYVFKYLVIYKSESLETSFARRAFLSTGFIADIVLRRLVFCVSISKVSYL